MLLIPPTAAQRQIAYNLITSPLPLLSSALRMTVCGGVERLVLDGIHSGRVKTCEDVTLLMRCTLLHKQNDSEQVIRIVYFCFI